jgi:C4-dicarboxylate-specific signal transduction histidine kinase
LISREIKACGNANDGSIRPASFQNGDLHYPQKPLQGERYVMADGLVLETVLSIILENAFVYGAARSVARRIDMTTSENAETRFTIITVQDSGPGFPDEVLAHGRELYSMDIQGHGLGVGIAIAKVLVEQMKGNFALSNNETGGCCTFSLPTAAQPTLP